MRNGVFFFGGKLRHGHTPSGKFKNRVISETALTAGLQCYHSLTLAAGGQNVPVRKNAGDAGDKARRAVRFSLHVSSRRLTLSSSVLQLIPP